jgi:hypothetical protein
LVHLLSARYCRGEFQAEKRRTYALIPFFGVSTIQLMRNYLNKFLVTNVLPSVCMMVAATCLFYKGGFEISSGIMFKGIAMVCLALLFFAIGLAPWLGQNKSNAQRYKL